MVSDVRIPVMHLKIQIQPHEIHSFGIFIANGFPAVEGTEPPSDVDISQHPFRHIVRGLIKGKPL